MTTSDPADHTELTDDRLDSLLRHADDELLHRIQAAVDPAITLTAVMDTNAVIVEQGRPGEPAHAEQAAVLIMRRGVLIQISRSLDRALDRAGDLARVLADDRVGDLDRALNRALDLDLNRALNRALDLDRDLALARARTRVRLLIPALNRARALARDLDRARDFVLALDRARDFVLALNRARDLARDLAEREIIASGADLSLLAIDDVEIVVGVVWDDETTWPPGIADHVRAASQEIRPGVYRVGGGSERDPAEYARY
ncbi:MAG TPA: hypothetical protein VFQ68_18995 [Streptosporangiaceae bacterium]|nr:hypothetical protein [Streptosporangiaceae bacterium]